MNPSLEPLRVSNLKDACVQRLEGLILSSELKAGERLPSERDLALRLNISRPVLHEVAGGTRRQGAGHHPAPAGCGRQRLSQDRVVRNTFFPAYL